MLDARHLSLHEDYLLAISGGRDSVCLLHLLLAAGFRNLHLVHLNHQLRGEESQGDAAFVESLAEEHRLPLTIECRDIAQYASDDKLSLETAARSARHQLLQKVATETHCQRILLAHHAEDQAETILFNLLRGSGGLKGIQPRATITIAGQALTLLRPLLTARRSQIDAYLSEHGIDYRDDRSNHELDFTRNRLRWQALPLLSDILSRDIVPALTRAQEIASQNEALIDDILGHLDLLDPQGRLFLPKLRELPASLQQAALRQFLKGNGVQGITHQLVKEAVEMIPPEGQHQLNLPGDRFLRRKQGRIFLS